jgi:glyoxylase-like metal-dependent hydrolase (beta-lactamase superfamily II)
MAHGTTRHVGDFSVTVLTDGATSFPATYFPATPEAEIAALLAAAGETEIRTNFNAALIRGGADGAVMVDAGPRDLFGPACGNMPAGLSEAGADPADIATLFLTHLHPDHAAGAVTPEGAAFFPQAELVMLADEHAYWTNDAHFAGANDTVRGFRTVALQVLAAYGDRLRLIAPDGDIAPGLQAIGLPGHTPGHAGWRLGSGDAQLVHVGDIIHAPVLQSANPEISVVFDLDAAAARDARKRLLAELAADGVAFTGGHLLAPAIVRARRGASGYVLEQAD